jgi:DNA-directed RNA polymerase specialized sigma24 family protein
MRRAGEQDAAATADSLSDQPTKAAPKRNRRSAEQAAGADGFRRYEAALARLEARDRRALHCRIELQQTYAELARSLGVASAAAARDVVTRALGRLVERMSQ